MRKNPVGAGGMLRLSAALFLVGLLHAASAFGADALPFISPLFGDNMVLQRGKPAVIWGWSNPGDAVRVAIQGAAADAVAGTDGKWKASLALPPVGGPYEVAVRGTHQQAVLHNILVGDVWLCGGQSNMFLGILSSKGGAEEVKKADHPDLRLYIVAQHSAYSPTAVPSGSWKVCSPQTLGEGGWDGFSAVAYYFARKVQDQLHIPIGLVEDCVGGSTAECWMSGESLASLGEFAPQVAAMNKLRASGAKEYGSFLMHWLDDYDAGTGPKPWFAADLPDAGWTEVTVPGDALVAGSDAAPAVCWFRREFTLPDPLPKGDAKIYLGSVDKMDSTYVNGQWVGASSWVDNPRVYTLPAAVLKPGRNMIAIRVFSVKPVQGFLAKAEVLRIALPGGAVVPLAGKWRAKVGTDPSQARPAPLDVENYATMPTVFYEGMIEPLAPMGITGVIWYQGEANNLRAVQYRKLLPGLIACWRSLFGQGDIPFYIVSLPAFMKHSDVPTDDGWAQVREVQAQTARAVPHSGLAVTIDTGEADNIHPKEKKVVGDRLALCALAEHYGIPVVDSGPVYASMDTVPGSIRLHFSHADGGLVVHGAKLGEFSVAAIDHVWHWADARIEGDTIVVSAPDVAAPVAARYAWQANPAATLFNGAGLPATPFRTDDWPFGTLAGGPN